MSVAEERTRSKLLEGWLPDGVVVDIVTERERRGGGWRAEIPAFRITEAAGSRDEAVASARHAWLSYLTEAASRGETYEQAQAARRSLLQTFSLAFLLVLLVRTVRRDASWWRVPGDMLAIEDWEAERETLAILEDEETMNALRESDEDLRAGRVKPYEDVRRDLGLD